jgi:glucosamine-6-phosphate deaminase
MTTTVHVLPDPVALGEALAAEIVAGIGAAGAAGRRYLLGCPGGRSPQTTYQALARRVTGMDLGHVVIVMMDDYLLPSPDGGWQRAPADAHYSCERFAREDIAGLLNATAARPIPPDQVWLPDPADPPAYETRIAAAGGVDLFLVASGASDGHVAFNPPGTPLDQGPWTVPLAETTRRDNMATFPDFASLDAVPTHGVSVGLGTIVRQSRSVRLVIHGHGKRTAAARVLGATGFDPAWPATFIHGCPDASIWLDAAAAPGGLEMEHLAGSRPGQATEEIG